MDAESIRNLPAGPELDKLIAEKVLGWSYGADEDDGGNLYYAWFTEEGDPTASEASDGLPAFSSDILAAWLVIEKMRSQGWEWRIISDYGRDGQWLGWVQPHYGPSYQAKADTAPLAICRAALLTLTQ